jgi:hypothetical protein
MTENNQKKSFVRKAGRTLLVKVLNGEFDVESMNLEGLVNQHFTEKSNSHFLTFDTAPNSLNAMRLIRKQYDTNVRVKVAHYRVFFTLENLEESMEYNTVKTQHRDMVQSEGNCSVLYYKLYRKNNKYLGCGDMTLDSKEGLDRLMSSEGLKTFTLECGVSGSHYRYRSQKQGQQAEVTTSA